MNAQNYKILIAGTASYLPALEQTLAQSGYQLASCADGSAALQQVLERQPDLLIVDTALRTIPVARLTQILRANPKSSELPMVFIGAEREVVEGFQRHRDHFLVRPPNSSQLLTLISNHFSRVEHVRQIGRQQKEVEGSLDQMALVDLLQVFGLNHKSGALHLKRGAERGTVYLENGCIINAQVGRVDGEKAFCRLLNWTSGNFRFTPGQPQVEVRLNGPVDHLIMDGLRIIDEMAAQAASLPAPNSRLVLRIPRERLPQGLRPATRDILLKLEYFPRVADLLDQCPYPDFQILQVLRVLREKGVIAESQGEDLPAAVSLLSAAEILTAHQFLFGAGKLIDLAMARVLVLTSDSTQARALREVLQGIAEFEPSASPSPSPVGDLLCPGDLGRLALSESFALRFIRLPAQAELQPLWPVFGHHLFGVLSLAPAGSLPEAERFFAALGRPVAYLDPQAPVGQSFPLKKGDRKGLAKLFSFYAAGFLETSSVAEAR